MNKTINELIQEVQMKRLKSLVLKGSEVVQFPEEILTFEWLEELVFGLYYDYENGEFCHIDNGMCNLSDLPNDLGKLKNLKLLSLSGSPFGGTKPEMENFDPVFELTNLEYLYLDGTKIKDISKIHKLKNLKHLNIAHTLITDFTPIKSLSKLESLTIGDNEINDIGFLSNLLNLKALSLTTNNITSVKSISSLTKLKRLCMCNNNIKSLRSLKNLIELKDLCISNCKILDYSFLKSLVNLEEIRTSDNLQLSWIKNNTKFEQVTVVKVTNTDLYVLENFEKVRVLTLEGDFDDISVNVVKLRDFD